MNESNYFMIKQAIAIVGLLIASFSGLGQGYNTIEGKVVDEETEQALAYATVTIPGKPIGTISNTKGHFTFHIPDSLRHEMLTISFLGYQNFEMPIKDILLHQQGFFTLRQSVMLLKEVVINAEDLSGKEIVEKAIRNIKLNYPKDPFLLDCFFREIEMENEKYVLLAEAAIELYEKSFITKRRALQEKINVKEVRRSHSFNQMLENTIGNAFVDLIENNDIRYQRGMLNTKKNNYKLDSVSNFNGRLVYVVSMSNWLDRGHMLIDVENYAFVSIGLERRKRKANDPYYFKWNWQDSLKIGRVMFSFTIEFKEYQGKMYVSHMTEDEENHVYNPSTGKIIINKKERLELIVNNIVNKATIDGANMKKLKYSSEFDIGDYNEEFWQHYNVLKLAPLDEKLLKDLEKEISLQHQFKSSGQKQ